MTGSLDSPCASVRIGVPGFLLYTQSRFRQDGAEPAGDVLTDVVHFVCVLSRAAGSICVGSILQDLHTTALALALLSALFLQTKCKPSLQLYRSLKWLDRNMTA